MAKSCVRERGLLARPVNAARDQCDVSEIRITLKLGGEQIRRAFWHRSGNSQVENILFPNSLAKLSGSA
jgi:hypothetical protein